MSGKTPTRPSSSPFHQPLSSTSLPLQRICTTVWAISCVADPGCLTRIPDTNFFHSRSRIRIFLSRIPDPHQKNLSILTPKNLRNMFRVVHPRSVSRILTFYLSRIPDSGVKKDGSATLAIPCKTCLKLQRYLTTPCHNIINVQSRYYLSQRGAEEGGRPISSRGPTMWP